MIVGGNLELWEWMKNIENGNYMGKYKNFFLFKSKDDWLLKGNIIAMCCKVYNICQKKIYENCSVKVEWGEREVNCCKLLT